jgi:hypothetical protein
MRQLSSISAPVGRFADALLEVDLPGLPAERRRQTVEFVEQRVSTLPSITRLGVTVIAFAVEYTCRLAGVQRVIALTTARPLPLLSEYPRLIRSLGFAFVWETWPDTSSNGAPA